MHINYVLPLSVAIKSLLDKKNRNDNYIINNVPKIVRGIFDEPLLVKFFTDHAQELGRNVTVKEGAKETIDKLINDGHKIIFITARSSVHPI